MAAAAALLTVGLYCSRASAGAHDAVTLPSPAVDLPRAGQARQVDGRLRGRLLLGHPGGLPARQGRHRRDVGLRRRLGRERQVRAGQRRRHRPRRIGAGHLRPVAGDVRAAPEGLLLRRAQSDRAESPGGRRGHPVPIGRLLHDADQKRVTDAYVAQLGRAKAFPDRIVTQIVPLPAFYPAEDYHQNYATRHPDNPYIVFNDAPKVAHLQQLSPTFIAGSSARRGV